MSADPASSPASRASAANHFAALEGVAEPVLVVEGRDESAAVYANRACREAFQLQREAILSFRLSDWLAPDAARRLSAAVGQALATGQAECREVDRFGMAARLKRVELGARRYCVITFQPWQQGDEAGRANAELRHRVGQLMSAMDLDAMAAWTWWRDSDRIEVDYRSSDGNAPRLQSRSMGEFLERVLEQDRELVRRTVDDALSTEQVHRFEFRICRADGETRWFGTAVKRFHDEHGSPAGLVGATRDVTARKKFYADLAESEGRLRSILEAEPECVKVVDRAGRLELMNPAGLGLLEVDDAQQVLGRPVIDLVAPEYRDAFQSLHEKVMAGQSGVLEFEIVGLKGGRCRVESHVAPLRDATGAVIAALAITRDVSELRLLAREIIEASNREQERIGHDLHDGVGQELTGVALMLKGLQGRLGRPPMDVERDIGEILLLVNAAIRSTRSLAHGLSPVAVQRGGLELALRALVERTRDTSGLKLRFTSRGWCAARRDPATDLHLYRIAQESLNNVLRHAGARRVSVSIGMTDSQLSLKIADDGKGFDPQAPSAAGLGLKIMGYRAQMIGARLSVTPRRGGGTVIALTCPSQTHGARGST